MSNYVLFSPLGMTDPTRGLRDGAFIHICRFYKPKKVYMYMSAEVCGYDELDNRYEIYLQRLCQKLEFDCEVIKIKRRDLISVHDFEYFFDDFESLLTDITDENPGADILLNLSSGTPAMKSVLYFLSTIQSRKFIPIQVSTPVKAANVDMAEGNKYNLELEWELNEDNLEENPPNRCHEVKPKNFNARLKKEIIKTHIAEYDYRAALAVAETVSPHLEPKVLSLLRIGKHRLMLETRTADAIARNIGYPLIPQSYSKSLSKSNMREAYEYILTMQIKAYRGEFADFARALSPIFTRLCEMYLEEQCAIPITKHYTVTGKGDLRQYRLVARNLPVDLALILDREFKQRYRDDVVTASTLVPFVKEKGGPKVVEIVDELRQVEFRVRNVAAHVIVSISDEGIYEETGHRAKDILEMLKELFAYCQVLPGEAWQSYERLNEAVINLL